MHYSQVPSLLWLSFFLGLIAFCLPILSLFGGTFVIIASFIFGTAFLIHQRPTFSLREKSFEFLLFTPLFWALLCFFLLAIVSLLWSYQYALSTYTLFKLTPFLCLWMFISWQKNDQSPSSFPQYNVIFEWIRCGFFLGYVLACLFLTLLPGIESMGYTPLSTKTKIQGGLFLSLSFWVVLKTLWDFSFFYHWIKGSAIIALCALSFYALKASACDTTLVSLILSMMIAILLYGMRSAFFKTAVKILILLSFLTTPFICFYGFSPQHTTTFQNLFHDPSYLHRLYLWHKTSHMILKAPFVGYGIGTSYIFSTPDTFDLEYKDTNGIKHTVKAEKMGLHPHNIALQLWLELGVLGALLGGWIISLVFDRVSKATSRSAFINHMGCFITTMIIFWINVGAFQTWWLSSIVCVILLFFSSNNRPSYAKKRLMRSKETS